MGQISVSEGRVCIIKTDELTSVRDGLDQIKTAIINCTTEQRGDSGEMDTFLFVDLSLFNIINSSVIGVLGSALMNPNIRLVGLCGVRPPVKDILTRFGVLAPEKGNDFAAHEALRARARRGARGFPLEHRRKSRCRRHDEALQDRPTAPRAVIVPPFPARPLRVRRDG